MSENRLAKARRNVFLESPPKYRWIAEFAMALSDQRTNVQAD
jgi:hypothetical protein